MCGRFGLIPTPEQVAELFALAELEDFPPRYNIAPTQPMLVVKQGHSREPGSNLPEREALLVRWGLIPAWAKDPKSLPLLINARAESAGEKAAFCHAMRYRRVLVPSSGFYEWKKLGPKERQPYWVRPRAGGVIAFAGLMETWAEPGGSEIDTGAILTTHANDDVRSIHDRMPVVIDPQDFTRWLNWRVFEPQDVADLLKPAEPGFFEAIPVSDRVNNHANVGADLMDRVEPRQAAVALDRKKQVPSKTSEAESSQLKLL